MTPLKVACSTYSLFWSAKLIPSTYSSIFFFFFRDEIYPEFLLVVNIIKFFIKVCTNRLSLSFPLQVFFKRNQGPPKKHFNILFYLQFLTLSCLLISPYIIPFWHLIAETLHISKVLLYQYYIYLLFFPVFHLS